MSLEQALRIERPDEPLRERVVRAVRQAILSGALLPGRRLTERELIELTGVSRTSVREALRHLQTLGLVEATTTRGLRVATLDKDSVQHIYEVRAALEPAAAELFVRRATDREVDELVRAREALSDDIEDRLASAWKVDQLLIRGARNPVLAATLEPLHTRIHALRRLTLAIPGRLEGARGDYRELVTAIRQRQPEQARRVSLRHVNAAAAAALTAVEMLRPHEVQAGRTGVADESSGRLTARSSRVGVCAMIHRRNITLTLAALAILTLSACSTSGGGSSSSGGTPSIEVAVSNATDVFGIPWLVGQKEGFFKKDGVIVSKIVQGNGGTQSLQTQLSGNIPIGDIAFSGVTEAIAKGAPVVAVAGATQSLNGSDFYALASNTRVKTVSDIKSWAYTNPGSVSQSLTYMIPQKEGISDAGVQRIASGGTGNGIALLESHKVDVTIIGKAVALSNPGKYRLVVSPSKVIGSFQQSVITTTESYLKSHAPVVKAVIDGYNDSVNWIAGHPDQAAAIYASSINIPVSDAEIIVESCIKAKQWGVGINDPALETAAQAMRLSGFTGKIDYCSIFDTSYLPSGTATALPEKCGS